MTSVPSSTDSKRDYGLPRSSGHNQIVDVDHAFSRYAPFVYRVLSGLGVERHAIDDCVQEVFLIAFRRWHLVLRDSHLRPWLFGIARRVASHHRRAQQRRSRREHAAAVPAKTASLDDAAERREAAVFVRQFCAQLDSESRSIFVAMELEGMTASEVADALSINVNTVYTKRRRLRERFRVAARGRSQTP